MGRELKRVPLDFNAPLREVWKGYVNPHYKKCPDCENGATTAHERLSDLISLLMISGSDSLQGKNHPYFDGIQKVAYGFNSIPSKDLAELTSGLAGRKCSLPFGHDACDRWSAVSKIIKAAGLPKNWGTCKTCKGDVIHPSVKKAYNTWRSKEPPKGKGFQLWGTTNEGEPISPVFKTLDELCEWCEPNATTFGSHKTTKENWKQMLTSGLVVHQESNSIFI